MHDSGRGPRYEYGIEVEALRMSPVTLLEAQAQVTRVSNMARDRSSAKETRDYLRLTTEQRTTPTGRRTCQYLCQISAKGGNECEP